LDLPDWQIDIIMDHKDIVRIYLIEISYRTDRSSGAIHEFHRLEKSNLLSIDISFKHFSLPFILIFPLT
jgi:hypothetical protein